MNIDKNNNVFRRTLFLGFSVALGLWVLWFITHLPSLAVPEPVSVCVLLAYWLSASVLVGTRLVPVESVRMGGMVGLTCAIVSLLALGSKLSHPADSSGVSAGTIPNAGLIAIGFILLGTALGTLGGFIGSRITRQLRFAPDNPAHWTARFSLVTAATMVPLLLIGGLVTTTNAGMAVPDWPNTYGSNMFLYPLGPRTGTGTFLEHSHRLFGTLCGLTVMVTLGMVVTSETRRWVRWWAVLLLPIVLFQGILGGLRVLVGRLAVTEAAQDDRVLHAVRGMFGSDPGRLHKIEAWMRVGHGVLGQLTFAYAVALAVFMMNAFTGSRPERFEGDRRIRVLATAALHTTILQLIFGAMYRHMRSNHALWSHAAFAIFVLVFATMAGIAASNARVEGSYGSSLRRAGRAVTHTVGFQFLLGWAAFFFAGRALEPEGFTQTLIRTLHHANGVAVLGAVTWLAVLAKRIVADRSSR